MNPTDWAAVATGVVAVVSGGVGAVRWLVKHYLAELKPNGGGSMSDRVKRIEDNQTRLHERVDAIFELLMSGGRK